MIKLGSHVGCSGANMLLDSVNEALSYGANCLMLYTGAPQNTIRKPLSQMKIKEANELLEKNNMSALDIVVHAPYIVNLANPDLEKRNFAIAFLSEEIKRTYAIGSKLIVLHPGCYLKQTVEEGISLIAYGINKMIENTKETDVIILLETMAGKGTEVGRTFEELKQIIDLVSDKTRIGVCFDTCHTNDAGYDLNHYEEVIQKFDEIIGIDMIKCFHINDSKNPLGSHKDRHANIGEGSLGLELLRKIVHDERFVNIPHILETPYINGVAPYKEEIELLLK